MPGPTHRLTPASRMPEAPNPRREGPSATESSGRGARPTCKGGDASVRRRVGVEEEIVISAW